MFADSRTPLSYCNSILQCLYYSRPFRECVINFPYRSPYPGNTADGSSTTTISPSPTNSARGSLPRINTDSLPTASAALSPTSTSRNKFSPIAGKEDGRRKNMPAVALMQNPASPNEAKDTPEARKKQALLNGPVLNIDQGNNATYGMDESLFTSLKDIFETIMAHESRTGVVSPSKFLEILRRDNDMFSGQQHQDAHEFLNYLLNHVIEDVDDYYKKRKNGTASTTPSQNVSSGSLAPANGSSAASTASATPSSPGWIHELFEGLLTSETKCLTCENVSRRDEQFLDLSIDLEKNSSVTSCLRNFSASEMLCERNKFHCDACGGLQEAEKRMKIKRLPKVLALHLKRFKYMEHLGRFEKLHYNVPYPYQLRLFNTTDDAEDPDRLYELYAVVVHIGGGPTHGHYVSIVKTEDRGWLLFDDELVEPVKQEFVTNFFGEKSGMACAYVLFYQETTLDAMNEEIWAEEPNKSEAATEAAGTSANGPIGSPIDESLPPLRSPGILPVLKSDGLSDPKLSTSEQPTTTGGPSSVKSKKEKEKEKKAEKEREKEREKAEKKAEKKGAKAVDPDNHSSGVTRFRNSSKSLRQPGRWLSGGPKGKEGKGIIKGDEKREKSDSKRLADNCVMSGNEEDDALPLPPTSGLPKTPGLRSTPGSPGLPPDEKWEGPEDRMEEPDLKRELRRKEDEKKERQLREHDEKERKERKEKEKREKKERKENKRSSLLVGLRKKASVMGVGGSSA
ncbi:hypothetical protein RUND412_010522 [Rhizina undulata]